MKKTNGVAIRGLQKYFLVTVLLLLLAGFLYFISPFFAVLIIAGVIAIDVYPMNEWLVKKLRYRALASFATLLIVALVIVTPFTLFISFVTEEAIEAYNAFSLKADFTLSGDITLLPERLRDSRVGEFLDNLSNSVPLAPEDILAVVQDGLQTASSTLVAQTTNIFKQVSLLMLYTIIFFISLYYFLYDGVKIVQKIKKLLPVPVKYKKELFAKLNDLSKGIVYGVFGAAIVQGFIGGIGFYLAGFGNAAFWGTIMALFSPVPYIGPSIIWGPGAVYLLITGHWVAGLFLFLWGFLVVSTVDNLVKPLLIGKSASINSLAILLTLIGGVLAFGIQGLVFGPFLLTLMFSFLHIYELEYKQVLKE